MDYNSVQNRLVTAGFSNEPDYCGNGNLTCNFITMYASDNMDIQWSSTFDGLVENLKSMTVTFSSDGSLVAFMYYNP